jgi:hypothetical protein
MRATFDPESNLLIVAIEAGSLAILDIVVYEKRSILINLASNQKDSKSSMYKALSCQVGTGEWKYDKDISRCSS